MFTYLAFYFLYVWQTGYLSDKGIETRPLFYPVHTMPMYSQKFQRHAIAEKLGWRGINLPSFPGLTNEQVIEICTAVKDFYK